MCRDYRAGCNAEVTASNKWKAVISTTQVEPDERKGRTERNLGGKKGRRRRRGIKKRENMYNNKIDQ